MVNELRTHLLDASSPNPSVETLLHAFLPHAFVDHSHADAILALTDQPDGIELAREAFGDRVAVLPYIMPGFPLAKAVADAVEQTPGVEGVVLAKHGLFSFGDDARSSYERHIALVDTAERFLEGRRAGRALLTPRFATPHREPEELAAMVAPRLRGFLAEPSGDDSNYRRVIARWSASSDILEFCASEEARALARRGPITPDHVIRTKSLPLFVSDPAWDDEDALEKQLREAVASYRLEYDRYFEEHARNADSEKMKLDSAPRVVILPGAGVFCFGRSAGDARIASDITRHTLRTKALAEAVGEYEALSPSELFAMEYWSLEQAKLRGRSARPLEGQVALITGGAGAIARGIATECARAGAHIVVADLDGVGAQHCADAICADVGPDAAIAVAMDVTDDASVRRGFQHACIAFGGVDLVVPNAGVALVERIETLSGDHARKVADVNYLGVLNAIREAARVFRLQGTGGHVVVNASKNVFAPGEEFGAYSASKAAATQISKIAAIELAPLRVRVNLINADAIFSADDVPSGLWNQVGPERAKRRGLEPEALPDYYQNRNLLKTRIEARHVGRAVVFFASYQTPTTGATLPIDGGIPEAFPR
jgi:rhamnose utilization protein RhaD (predicted bifunctional aldolase and dehydrogenase)/NAD(P)-dependent dehydrogenase (short-subunit alcohol dehydrogenase family)